MPDPARSASPIVVVLRHSKPPFGYRWEIRAFSFGAALERATRSYPSAEQAFQAGNDALRALPAVSSR